MEEEEEAEVTEAREEVKIAMVKEESAGSISNIVHEENKMGLTSEEEG